VTRKDPLRHFRVEAREIVDSLEAGLLRGAQGEAEMRELFRLAHTLKGAARLVQQGTLADLSHALEDVLDHHRESGEPLSDQEQRELLMLVDGLRRGLPANQQEGSEAAPGATVHERDFDVLRIPVEDMDALATSVLEAQVRSASLKDGLKALAELTRFAKSLREQALSSTAQPGSMGARTRASLDELVVRVEQCRGPLVDAFEQLERELNEVGESTAKLRLVDVSVLFPELERAVHDASRTLGREIAFSAQGFKVGIDAHVLGELRGALLHLVNNAVAHGIEDAEERRACGKSARGAVTVRVERRGARVAVRVEDDGRGIDTAAVRRAAEARPFLRGLDPSLSPEALIFEPGLSTAAQVSDLAGRGVGLDAVREAVSRCKGTVAAFPLEHAGTCFEIVVPSSLTAVRALAVTALDQICLVPLEAIESTVHLADARIVGRGADTVIAHGDVNVPFRALAAALDPTVSNPMTRVGVLVHTRQGRLMLGVESLGETREVIVQPLPRAAGACPFAAGAAFDALGDPQLVLDLDGLHGLHVLPRQVASGAAQQPLLIIDDSLTTRMLEQSILETAGYNVELASSAEEGLSKLRENTYALVIVDVEMPGMNGYEFTQKLRASPVFGRLPVIMVSSLASVESRRRGEEAGISAYIVKGEFDQGRFLRTVAELLS
jgi:two-component system chemotaxis sensor kinase CheA